MPRKKTGSAVATTKQTSKPDIPTPETTETIETMEPMETVTTMQEPDGGVTDRGSDNDILQLHLSAEFIDSVVENGNHCDNNFPCPYEPNSTSEIHIETDVNPNTDSSVEQQQRSVCFWCCHPIVNFCGHMPLNYNYMTGNFKVFGVFCSFPCMSAYNFSINSKSDRLWQINTLINMIAYRYGYNENVRPAPSRYLLKMFGGSMDIEDFRNCHNTYERSHIMNIPPMICISGTPEVINTSYVNKVAKK